MREIWLPVVEFEGTYEVSNTGKIRRLATKGKPSSGNYARSAHEIKPHKNNKGYLVVDLWQENQTSRRKWYTACGFQECRSTKFPRY